MNSRVVFIVAALTALGACSTVPTKDIEIVTNADQTVNFGAFQTYGWLASTGLIRDAEGRWSGAPFNIGERIQYLVDQEFGKRGIQLNNADPELLVIYGIGVDMDNLDLKTDEKTDYLTATNVPAGSLLIVLVDARTGYTVWVASAEADIQDNPDEETMKKRLEYAVSNMFKELPQ